MDWGHTVRIAPAWAFHVIAAVRHCYLVLLEDVPAPHALCIYAGVRPTTKGTSESGLLAVGPSIWPLLFQVFFPGGTPAAWRFEGSRVSYRVGVFTILVDVIFWNEEPVEVFRQGCVGDTLRIQVLVGERREGVAKKDGIGVCRKRIQAEG